MATFHRMHDENGRDVVRAFVKGAPDQLLARAASRPDPEDLSIVPGRTTRSSSATWTRTSASRARACA